MKKPLNNLRVILIGTTILAAPSALAQQAAPPAPASGPEQSADPSASQADAQQIGPQQGTTSDGAIQDDIVVTGSSIRGVAPTGSALVNVARGDIVASGATTTTELLRTVPQIGAFNQSGNNNGQNQANFVDQPAIHGVGTGNGGGGLTLVLLDGLRLPGAGINQTAPDPSAVPPSAIERVEVVADGASSIYGSDAVAGVINFILRKNVDGVETSGRIGFGDSYRTYNAYVLGGKTWEGGSILLDYEFSKNTSISGLDRSYIASTPLAQLCSPANVTVGGTVYGLTGSGAPSTTPNTCDNNKANDLYPAQHRHQVLASIRHEIVPGLELHARTVYSARKLINDQAVSGVNTNSGGLAVDVASGPFYDAIVAQGLPAGTHSVTYNGTGDFGQTLRNRTKTRTWSTDVGVRGDIAGDWQASLDLNYGRERDHVQLRGINQALLQQLVTAGRYNPYGVGTANDAALVEQVGSFRTQYFGKQEVKEALVKTDGTLFALPGGSVKAAIGGSYREEKFLANVSTGPDDTAPQTETLGKRKIWSAYGELFVPLFGEANETAFFRRLDVSLSARYDHYDDVGSTTNPKIGVNWEPVKGVLLHGSYGTSFHAPSLADAGTAIDTRVIRYADNTGAGPGAYSILLAGGNRLDPEEATTWSAGVDLKPEFAPGLKLSTTYFNIDYRNVITFPTFRVVTEPNNPIFDRFRTYAPTEAQVLAAIAGMRKDGLSYPEVPALPTAIYDLRRQNFATQKIDGIDFDLQYAFGTTAGDFNLGVAGTWLFTFDQTINGDDVTTSLKNTAYAVDFKARGRIAWSKGNYDAAVFLNYTNKFTNTFNNAKVDPFVTVDLHGGIKLPFGGIASDTQFTVDVSNLLDEEPPYILNGNGVSGFDPTTASALGRVVTIGFRKSF
jgi:iron complex outermembrane receptor protein